MRVLSYVGVEPRLPPVQLRAWRTAYRQARVYHHAHEGPVADLVVREWYDSRGKVRTFPKRVPMPEVGLLVWLGYLLEVHTCTADGRIWVTKWPRMRSPDLLWSDKLQACVAYPGFKMPVPTVQPYEAPKCAKLFSRWHAGKRPSGLSPVRLPTPTFRDISPCIATVYLSDKFDRDGVFREYIHHHEGGVLAYLNPEAVIVRGGKLELTRDGLIH